MKLNRYLLRNVKILYDIYIKDEGIEAILIAADWFNIVKVIKRGRNTSLFFFLSGSFTNANEPSFIFYSYLQIFLNIFLFLSNLQFIHKIIIDF